MQTRAWTRRRIRGTLTELIRRTASDLPSDVENALHRARAREAPNSRAAGVFDMLLENIRMARTDGLPMCQDTGTPTFEVLAPLGSDVKAIEDDIRCAVVRATRRGHLRLNTIDAVRGASLDNNLGTATPVIHIHFAKRDRYDVRLLLKGGGCENVSRQYALPDESLGAGRDLEGVRRCVLDAVWQAQGAGCAPGILGVCVGGDRATGFSQAKAILWRKLGVPARDPLLADLERRLLPQCNALGIGPMGMGGETTILGINLCAAARLPASFFVTVAYMCWACRRRAVTFSPEGVVLRWKE